MIFSKIDHEREKIYFHLVRLLSPTLYLYFRDTAFVIFSFDSTKISTSTHYLSEIVESIFPQNRLVKIEDKDKIKHIKVMIKRKTAELGFALKDDYIGFNYKYKQTVKIIEEGIEKKIKQDVDETINLGKVMSTHKLDLVEQVILNTVLNGLAEYESILVDHYQFLLAQLEIPNTKLQYDVIKVKDNILLNKKDVAKLIKFFMNINTEVYLNINKEQNICAFSSPDNNLIVYNKLVNKYS